MASIPAKAISAAKPHITKFLFYAKTELAPPKPSEIPAIISGFGRLLGGIKSGAWKKATVKTKATMGEEPEMEDSASLHQ